MGQAHSSGSQYLRILLALTAGLLLGGCGLSEYQKKMASEQKRLEKHDRQTTKASGKTTKP